MKYLVTDGGIQFVDDDYNPITLEAALEAVRRVAAYVEAIGNEPQANTTDAEIGMGAEARGGERTATAA